MIARVYPLALCLCLDAQGRIYVNDRNLCRVFRMDCISGAGLLAFGQQGYGGGGPLQGLGGGMALDGQGRIYVVITRSSKLVRSGLPARRYLDRRGGAYPLHRRAGRANRQGGRYEWEGPRHLSPLG